MRGIAHLGVVVSHARYCAPGSRYKVGRRGTQSGWRGEVRGGIAVERGTWEGEPGESNASQTYQGFTTNVPFWDLRPGPLHPPPLPLRDPLPDPGGTHPRHTLRPPSVQPSAGRRTTCPGGRDARKIRGTPPSRCAESVEEPRRGRGRGGEQESGRQRVVAGKKEREGGAAGWAGGAGKP
eukprot:365244-Chlamydomonas_euryale.AAC.20